MKSAVRYQPTATTRPTGKPAANQIQYPRLTQATIAGGASRSTDHTTSIATSVLPSSPSPAENADATKPVTSAHGTNTSTPRTTRAPFSHHPRRSVSVVVLGVS